MIKLPKRKFFVNSESGEEFVMPVFLYKKENGSSGGISVKISAAERV